MNRMYCMQSDSTDIYFNLAAEEYLLKNAPDDFFMLWKSEPSVVVGKHQNVFKEVNINFIEDNRIKIARRYSGGGTVYHDRGNLNLTFIETSRNADFDKFTGWMMDALSHYNLNVSRDERRGIYIDGRKISGSAQCMYKDRILYHATLLYDTDLDRLVSSLEVSEAQSHDTTDHRRYYIPSVKSPVTNITAHMREPAGMERFQDFIWSYFLNKQPGNEPYQIGGKDLEEISMLRNNKYATHKWCFNTL